MPNPSEDDTSSLRKVTKRFKTRSDAQQPSYPAALDPVAIPAYNPIQMMMPTNAVDGGPTRFTYNPECMPTYASPHMAGAGSADFHYVPGYTPTYLPSHDLRQGIPAVSSASVSKQ